MLIMKEVLELKVYKLIDKYVEDNNISTTYDGLRKISEDTGLNFNTLKSLYLKSKNKVDRNGKPLGKSMDLITGIILSEYLGCTVYDFFDIQKTDSKVNYWVD